MRNKKRRLAMMQQREAEFRAHQDAMKALADQEAKAKAEAEAKAKAAAAAKAQVEAKAKAKAEEAAKVAKPAKEEPVHSHDLASPEASKPSTKKSKSRTKKASK